MPIKLRFKLGLRLLAVSFHLNAELLDQSSIVGFLMIELRFTLVFGCVQLFAQSGYLLLTFDLELCFLFEHHFPAESQPHPVPTSSSLVASGAPGAVQTAAAVHPGRVQVAHSLCGL